MYTHSSKNFYKYRSKTENLIRYGLKKDYDRCVAPILILDNSLITRTNKKIYQVKMVDCGDNVEIWDYSSLKLRNDKNLEKDKINFIVHTEKIEDDFTAEEKKYNDYLKTYFNNPMYKDKFLNFELEEKINELSIKFNLKNKNEKKEKKEKKIEIKNIYRSKFEMTRLVKANYHEFKTFVTLTFAENLQDISLANHEFQKFIRTIKKYFKRNFQDFKYIVVPEFQKRGAVHYHLLTNIDYDDEELLEDKKIYNQKKGWLEFKIFTKYWNHGITSVEKIKDNKITGYITKFSEYMTKDCDNRLWGKRRYSYSYNLRKPSTVYLNLNDSKELQLYLNILWSSSETYSKTYLDSFGNEISYKCLTIDDSFDKNFIQVVE